MGLGTRLHSPSEWPVKTFAGGMPKAVVPSGVHNAVTQVRQERGPQTPVDSKATGVKEWYAWEVM